VGGAISACATDADIERWEAAGRSDWLHGVGHIAPKIEKLGERLDIEVRKICGFEGKG